MLVTQYLLSHWRAEQHLGQMTLVNGILGYVLVLTLGGLIGMSAWSRIIVYPYAVLFLAWGVWVIFGIGRAAWRLFTARNGSPMSKVGAVFLFLAVSAISVIAAHDVWILMRA